jgi:hypothetical protein
VASDAGLDCMPSAVTRNCAWDWATPVLPSEFNTLPALSTTKPRRSTSARLGGGRRHGIGPPGRPLVEVAVLRTSGTIEIGVSARCNRLDRPVAPALVARLPQGRQVPPPGLDGLLCLQRSAARWKPP